jgi:hypothetical protein
MNEYKWERFGDRHYYYNVATGKVVGTVSKIALQDVWISLVYIGEYSFTVQDEKHLGQYISMEFAKEAAQRFWDIQNRTLLEQ